MLFAIASDLVQTQPLPYILCVCLPVRGVQGRPVWGRRSCQGCRARGGRGRVAECPEADQRSHTGGRWRLTLQQERSPNSLITHCLDVAAGSRYMVSQVELTRKC